jgi:hypothetical protein
LIRGKKTVTRSAVAGWIVEQCWGLTPEYGTSISEPAEFDAGLFAPNFAHFLFVFPEA